MNAIEIKDLSKNFGSINALNNITTVFEKGKITGLIGRNGAGKTTLLNIISSRLKASKGTVTTDGEKVFENDSAMRKTFYMSVTNFFPSEMKVRHALKAGKALLDTFDEQEAMSYLRVFEIPLNRKIAKLSTGMQSLFKLALTLASNAQYLLLDEPVLGLDANNRDLAYRLLIEKQAQTQCGVVLSTHLIEEISKIIEDVCVIHKGKILRSGTTEDLLNDYFILSGPKEAVEDAASSYPVISRKELAGYTSVGLQGNLPLEKDLPENVTLSAYPLQQLFIDLTGNSSSNSEVL